MTLFVNTDFFYHVVPSTQAAPLFSGVLFYIFRGQSCGGVTLQSCGISERSTVAFSLSTFCDESSYDETFFINDVVASVQQTQKGISVFLSSLYAVVSSVYNILFPFSCYLMTLLFVSILHCPLFSFPHQ